MTIAVHLFVFVPKQIYVENKDSKVWLSPTTSSNLVELMNNVIGMVCIRFFKNKIWWNEMSTYSNENICGVFLNLIHYHQLRDFHLTSCSSSISSSFVSTRGWTYQLQFITSVIDQILSDDRVSEDMNVDLGLIKYA